MKRRKYQEESTNVSMVSVSLLAQHPALHDEHFCEMGGGTYVIVSQGSRYKKCQNLRYKICGNFGCLILSQYNNVHIQM